MMGRILLFTSWASLLIAAVFSAYYTGNLQYIDRQAVATVVMVSGEVFQRPENYSVYEMIKQNDSVFEGDYISTGAGAKAEVQLLDSKTILIGENSMIQLSFGVDTEGVGSDIVTLLKGDVSSKAEVLPATQRSVKKLSFKVGKSSLKNIETSAGIEISKKLEQTEASVRVVSGTAQIIGDDNVVKEIKKNQTVVIAAVKAPTVQTARNSVGGIFFPVELPVIKVAPEKIAVNDSKIMTAPVNLVALSFAAKSLVEDTVVAMPAVAQQDPPKLPVFDQIIEMQPVKLKAVGKPKKPIAQVPVPKPAAPTAPEIVKLAAVSKIIFKVEAPPPLVFYKAKPQDFSGRGIYFVKNQLLYAKATGNLTQSDLVALAKKHNVSFCYEGSAESFLGGADQWQLTEKKEVFAVDRNGIQKIDAALLRTRPAALELLRRGGFAIFDEKVNVLSVGH